MYLWGIFLISDWYERIQPPVDNATPGQVVLRFIRNQVNHEPGKQTCKRYFSTPSASIPVSRFLPWVPTLPSFSGLCDVDLSLSFISHFGSWCFTTATESQLRHITFLSEASSSCLSSLLLQCWRWSLGSHIHYACTHHMWYLQHSSTAGFTIQSSIAVAKDYFTFMCMSVFSWMHACAHGRDPGSRVIHGCELSTGC